MTEITAKQDKEQSPSLIEEPKSKWLGIYEAEDGSGNIIKDIYILYNELQREKIGTIEKRRVGKFMHWCLMPFDDTYFTNGCLKEISTFITKLYSKQDETL